jgi:hypothetical protein
MAPLEACVMSILSIVSEGGGAEFWLVAAPAGHDSEQKAVEKATR